ncbi:CRISPR type III-A/MTUBE-associated RAMP protein Csm5 [Clostridium cochlearium]|uniref:CRISPR type III-A/MTUBE-associated RAMP protein Csm5 n=1 Tax=Clostridium cochlearium TaxID=1494 RepID=A0ABY0QP31_CLOCO|nr:RAMP superfamily CRISPR-associated protein [Clostridium cochlearium]SDL41941.1 CRISPR type III-A/MTUBE-associated RAMP protein Csm5 [Clostridium cochlearium]
MSTFYEFVPFINYEPYKNRGDKSGKIDLKITALTPIHVSSGSFDTIDNKKIYKSFVKSNNKVLIPGTSLKGCIRNICEAISHSCLEKLAKNIDISKVKDKKEKSRWEKCIICDMFGTMGQKSKIQFSDFKEEKVNLEIISLPQAYSPNPKKEKYFNERGNYKGYKFYRHGINGIQIKGDIPYEFVMDKSTFIGDIVYRNLSEEQLELLCFSLGLNGDIQPKIGYGKDFLYGSIKIETKDKKYIEKANNYKNIKDENIKSNIDKLTEILSYENAVTQV